MRVQNRRGEQVILLNRPNRVDFIKKVTTESRPEGGI